MKKMPLNLTFLKYFFDAVKEGSISNAAKANFVSQSAVSQAINKLEESLQCKLLSHKPTRFKLTEKGQLLFEHCKELFFALRRAEECLAHEEMGSVTFGCTHSFALALLPEYLKRAKKELPNTSINLRLGHCHSIKEWLKKGRIDFGILIDNDDHSGFHCRQIYEGAYRLYASKECKEPHKLSFLLDSEERRETNLLKRSYQEQFGKELPVFMEISSWEVIANLAEKGLGIGFFPDYVAYPRKKALKCVLPELGPIPYKVYALHAKNVRHSSHVEQFLNLLTNNIK